MIVEVYCHNPPLIYEFRYPDDEIFSSTDRLILFVFDFSGLKDNFLLKLIDFKENKNSDKKFKTFKPEPRLTLISVRLEKT